MNSPSSGFTWWDYRHEPAHTALSFSTGGRILKEKQLCEFTMNKQINKTHFYIDVAHERKKRP